MAKKPQTVSETPLEALNKAIQLMGGIVKAAASLGVTISAIGGWRAQGQVSHLKVRLVEEKSGVSCKRLRPDLYA